MLDSSLASLWFGLEGRCFPDRVSVSSRFLSFFLSFLPSFLLSPFTDAAISRRIEGRSARFSDGRA